MWKKEQLFEFRPGMKLTDVPDNKTLIMQMEHLRQMDYAIARGISYEKTVQTFLIQLELSDELRPLKKMQDFCILLNEEGVLMRFGGELQLIFTPDRLEKNTLTEDAELWPVFNRIIDATKKGKKRWIHLDNIPVSELMSGRNSIDILDKYCIDYPGGYMAVAKKVVIEGPKELYSNVAVCSYGALKTVDLSERESYDSIIELMSDYIGLVDRNEGQPVRPLSLAVFGAPGSGKSFGVKQLAKSLGRFSIFTLNLSQYNSVDELMCSLKNALENSKDIPLIFMDEFDSDYNGKALGWLKFLLAPMQDGEYSCNGRIMSIDKAVFVFAGGTASSFDEFIPVDKERAAAFRLVKGPDFVSRLRGILNIKGPNPSSITDNAFIIRRALLLRDLITRKMPGIYNSETGIINISPGLLSGFLRTKEYKHGTRSMEFVLDMSHISGMNKYTPACLPMKNQMNIHVDYEDFCNRFSFDRYGAETVELLARRTYERDCVIAIENAKRKGLSEEIIVSMRKQQPTWEWLNEKSKNGYIEFFRGIVEGAENWSFPMGIRPCSDDKESTVTELYGELLDKLAELAFSVDVDLKRRDGWRYYEYENEQQKLSPMICDFSQLNKKARNDVMNEARKIPERLREVGLELYRKNIQ